MKVIIDEDAGKVYVAIHDEHIPTEVTHTLEKHGTLLHWDGHGKLMGIEFAAPEGSDSVVDVRYVAMNGANHA